jgi:alkylation response protein AidB-like acyl-CoA dehydrogenase
MDIFLDDELRQFRDAIARWVDERLAPRADEIDRANEFPRALFRELSDLGYFGVLYSEAYGGSDMAHRYLAYTLLCEELSRGHMGFASIVCMHASTATHTIASWGSESLRQRYLIPAIRGELVGAFAITEPDAGSDAGSIRTRAVPCDGGWRITGTKIFTSQATIADFISVAATTDPQQGARGIKLFLVDTKSEGFQVSRKLEKLSTHGADTAELVLTDVFVPAECLLAGEDGNGMNAYRALTVDRIFTAALAIGNGRAAYDAALAYAQQRHQFGQPIGKFQAVQFRLVDMLAKLDQARLYTYHAAMLADQGASITMEAALAKMIAAENCNEVCQKALSVFGGYGLINEFPAQRFLRDSFFPMIGGGTGDIMRLIVARQMGL